MYVKYFCLNPLKHLEKSAKKYINDEQRATTEREYDNLLHNNHVDFVGCCCLSTINDESTFSNGQRLIKLKVDSQFLESIESF